MSEVGEGPELRIELPEKLAGGGLWRTRFRVTNEGRKAVALQAAWMPHVVFRAEEIDLSSEPAVGPGESIELTFDASYAPREDPNEPANPFLILRALSGGVEWRVLAQLRVQGAAGEAPEVGVAAVNAHRVGFSSGLK